MFKRLLTPCLNCSKSSNALVRTGAVQLFRIIARKAPSEASQALAATELLSLPKAGKTSGPDHRVALYTMLLAVAPSIAVSASIAQTVPVILAKETHDASVAALMPTLAPHIIFLLRSGTPPPTEATTGLAKEMNNTKPVLRRAFCSIAGAVLWDYGNLDSSISLDYAKALLSAFETNLKNVTTNALGAAAGPLEAYIALAVLLGPLSRSGQFSEYTTCILM